MIGPGVARRTVRRFAQVWLAVSILTRAATAQERCGDQDVAGKLVFYCRAGGGEPIIVLEAEHGPQHSDGAARQRGCSG